MDSWKRSHTGIDVLALVIAQKGNYLVSIKEPEGENRFPADYTSDDEEGAKRQADELIQAFYNHNCDQSGCEQWQQFNSFV
jgi:hypothetical protein